MPLRKPMPLASLMLAGIALLFSACASTPRTAALKVGEQATIEGSVVSVDTAPWAYDGNAVVTVASASAGTVRVQLPARWNLCKAAPPDDLQALKAGDRVQAIGEATARDDMVVCALPAHRLRRID